MMPACPACEKPLQRGLIDWHMVCDHCSYEGSTLVPRILDQAAGGDIDEEAREHGLSALRQDNFQKIRSVLSRLPMSVGRQRKRLLDVGCAHGWFLQICANDFVAEGIEPDPVVAAATLSRGLPVRTGFFPDVLGSSDRFEIILFNDVLEHIPDIRGTLSACHRHLSDNGYLVVNAPARTGFLYRFSKLLARVGFAGAFGRLWQVGLPSPHVHYLDAETMGKLAESSGFELERTMKLPAVSAKGLYDRIHCTNDISVLKAVVITFVVMLAIPFLRLLPSDIEVWFLRKKA